MYNPSLSDARQGVVAINTAKGRKLIQPHTNEFQFHTFYPQKNHPTPKPSRRGGSHSRDTTPKPLYLIDPRKILKALERDDLPSLHKLTLLGTSDRNDAHCMWDSLFNQTARHHLSACIFSASPDYSPLPQSRVSFRSTFLDYTKGQSRIHLNQIREGDRIGISIDNATTQVTYVLLYVVEDLCHVAHKPPEGDSVSVMIPAFNVVLEQVMDIRSTETLTVSMDRDKPFNQEAAQPFIQRLYDATYDITEAYPWKPHFLPVALGRIDKETILQRLRTEYANATEIGYAEFEALCRKCYNLAASQLRGQDGSRPKDQARNLPMVEVFTSEDRVYAKFEMELSPVAGTVSFPRSDLDRVSIVEKHLANKDINFSFILDDLSVFCFKENDADWHLRYFRLNF
jgi:hypothetical protein